MSFLWSYWSGSPAASGEQTQTQTHRRRAVVVGSGLVGVSTAYYLRQRGFDVTVLERRGEAACAADGG
jgi:D-amino-acid dehydrogenase